MSEVEGEIGNTMMKRQDERKSGKDVVLNKVGIFSARTPNRFVGFFLVVEGELNSVYLLPPGRSVG